MIWCELIKKVSFFIYYDFIYWLFKSIDHSISDNNFKVHSNINSNKRNDKYEDEDISKNEYFKEIYSILSGIKYNEVIFGNAIIINVYQVVDGLDYPVNITFKVNNIERVEKSYEKLRNTVSDFAKPKEGIEYIIITLSISYSGDL